MTAAADKRLGRLLGRIAEERVARGRQATSYRPKVLPTGLSGVDEEPENRGGEAVFVGFVESPRRPAASYSISYFVADSNGRLTQVYKPVQTTFILVEGVDYPGWLTDYGPQNTPMRKVASKKVPKVDKLKTLFEADAAVGFDDGENLNPTAEIPEV